MINNSTYKLASVMDSLEILKNGQKLNGIHFEQEIEKFEKELEKAQSNYIADFKSQVENEREPESWLYYENDPLDQCEVCKMNDGGLSEELREFQYELLMSFEGE